MSPNQEEDGWLWGRAGTLLLGASVIQVQGRGIRNGALVTRVVRTSDIDRPVPQAQVTGPSEKAAEKQNRAAK